VGSVTVDLFREPGAFLNYAATLARRHAEALTGQPSVRVIALDVRCPHCGGYLLRGQHRARCASCGAKL
jgi:hypothetical protein